MLREEITHPTVEHDALVARDFTVAIANVLLSDGGVDRALVVMMRNGAPLGVLLGDNRWTDLDGLPLDTLGAALAAGREDDALASIGELLRLPFVDVEVVRGARGGCIGVVAIATEDAQSQRLAGRAGRALARAASALGAWVGAGLDAQAAALALIGRIDHAVLVHDHDLVLAANGAAARLIGLANADALVGIPLARVFPRLPRLPFFAAELGMRHADGSTIRVCTREHALVLAGRGLRALLVEPAVAPSGPPPAELAGIIDAIVIALRGTLRRAARVNVVRSARPLVAAEAAGVREALELALLDVASVLDERAAADNRIDIAIHERADGDVCVEVTGSGSLVASRCASEPIGAALCGVRLGGLGGDLEVASTVRERRVLRLVFPGGRR